ncbi:hypothetical protein QOZ80_3BG0260790 [Eleusine coracana subsp. coracana]|nr:hypothetical protein QOZ80_3BG0260790 [Eleusine coracana subsp. coracana]
MSWRRFNFRQGPPAWSSGLRPLGRCSTQKPAPCAVVVIDEEDDGGGSDSEVFIVDAAAGKACPTPSSNLAKKGDGPSGNVINLDDDEEEVEEVSRGDKAGPSTSRGAGSPAATTPGRASSMRNRYGLNCSSDSSESDLSEGVDSESESEPESEPESDDSTSDCEIMDNSTARKMWETAASSKKKMSHGFHKGNTGMATASASSSGSETQPGENGRGLFDSECHLDEDIFRFFEAADPQFSTSRARDVPAENNLNGNMHFSGAWNQSSSCGAKDGHGPSTVPGAKERSNGNVSDGKETECVQNSNGDAKDSHINEEAFQHFTHADKEGAQNTTGAAKDCHDPSSGQNASECSHRNVKNGKRYDSSTSHALNSDTTHFRNDAVPEKASDGIKSPHLNETFVDSFVSAKRVFPTSSSPSWKYGSPPMSVSTPEKMDERIDQSPLDAHNVTSGNCSLSQKDVVDGSGQVTLSQEASNFQDGLIGEREKHKETAEFKRAAEEEWASRQRQLQIQAEEAKKLRKRKKAEALRLLDMEKKQKQRLEEVRESHKKNEEEKQLKEQYRCVVRKELEDTERRYRDTLSILRVLGIPCKGGEVRIALKQAQVKFHPDKVSRSDIYQQVKAEETFKFISRLKEKLPQ